MLTPTLKVDKPMLRVSVEMLTQNPLWATCTTSCVDPDLQVTISPAIFSQHSLCRLSVFILMRLPCLPQMTTILTLNICAGRL